MVHKYNKWKLKKVKNKTCSFNIKNRLIDVDYFKQIYRKLHSVVVGEI